VFFFSDLNKEMSEQRYTHRTIFTVFSLGKTTTSK